MAKKRTTTRKRNHDVASSKKKFKGWSDLNHDVLYLVMKQLGVIDFISFGRVCKSWRSLALCNRKMLLASTLPMPLRISKSASKKTFYCDIEDFDGMKFKTIILHCARYIFVGSTFGYLILLGKKTCDFCLVNPITKDRLHFPNAPIFLHDCLPTFKAILVFSPFISRWVFIILIKSTHNIWFAIAGKGAWNHVLSDSPILDLHAFKGKIYTIHTRCQVYEMRLNQEPNLTFLGIKNYWKQNFVRPEFVNSGENLYVVDQKYYEVDPSLRYKVVELDLGRMMWVSPEKTYAIFISRFMNSPLAIKPEAWVDPPPQYKRYELFNEGTSKGRIYNLISNADMWYFPLSCRNDNLLQ